MRGPAYVIFLNGVYGVGKSAALEHIGDQLANRGMPFSLMDVDWFHRSWPVAADDPANVVLEARNIASVWETYQTAGPRQLIMSGVITSQEALARYEHATQLQVRPIRLTASLDVVRARLRARYSSSQSSVLEWHIERLEGLEVELNAACVDEASLDTTHRSAQEVACRVLKHFGMSQHAL